MFSLSGPNKQHRVLFSLDLCHCKISTCKLVVFIISRSKDSHCQISAAVHCLNGCWEREHKSQIMFYRTESNSYHFI